MATDYYKMGMGLGGAYFDGQEDGRQRQRQMDKDARETTEFNDRQTELQYQRAQRQGVDDAFANVQGLQTNGVYAGGNTSGMSDGSAEMLFKQGGQKQVDETASYANVENRRMGMAPAQQTSAPNAPTVQSRKATGLDMNRAMLGVATAKKDIGAMQSLQAQGVEMEWDDTFGKKLKEYTGSDEQIGASAQFLNDGSKRITMSDAEPGGFVRLSVVKPDGRADFLKLTKQDQAQLYAAGSMMEANPTKALTIMAGINKNLAAAIAADNGIEFKLGDNANDVAGKRGDLAHKGNVLAETGRHNRAVEGIQRERTNAQTSREKEPRRGAPVQMIDAQGNAALMQPVQGADGKLTYEPVNLPQGMRFPKQVDPAAIERRAAALEGKPMQGLDATGKARVYDADTAYNAARAQLYGQEGGGSELDKRIAAMAKGGGKTEQTGMKPQVPGRPLYNADMRSLEAMARKPRGVSSAEANDAAAELEARKGESRIQGF